MTRSEDTVVMVCFLAVLCVHRRPGSKGDPAAASVIAADTEGSYPQVKLS
jgi:hypothetical protein